MNEEIAAIVKQVLTEDLGIEISTTERGEYGYGGSTVWYTEVTVRVTLDGEVIKESTDSFPMPSCRC